VTLLGKCSWCGGTEPGPSGLLLLLTCAVSAFTVGSAGMPAARSDFRRNYNTPEVAVPEAYTAVHPALTSGWELVA
jgi:hypothetical protein